MAGNPPDARPEIVHILANGFAAANHRSTMQQEPEGI
jgi:hypothetical protein